MFKIVAVHWKIVLVALLLTVFSMIAVAEGGQQITDPSSNKEKAVENERKSSNQVPVPNIQYFPERQTIARWAREFDTPNITCYLYLVQNGQILGYYITNGKPASTQSYLTPEYGYEDGYDLGEYSGVAQVGLPDIDGTYGNNSPGIRFFTASGIAVEWGGYGATYIFSTAKLPLNVPEFGK
jgi:hypothetical protein